LVYQFFEGSSDRKPPAGCGASFGAVSEIEQGTALYTFSKPNQAGGERGFGGIDPETGFERAPSIHFGTSGVLVHRF
jgi:hypothetical protein